MIIIVILIKFYISELTQKYTIHHKPKHAESSSARGPRVVADTSKKRNLVGALEAETPGKSGKTFKDEVEPSL